MTSQATLYKDLVTLPSCCAQLDPPCLCTSIYTSMYMICTRLSLCDLFGPRCWKPTDFDAYAHEQCSAITTNRGTGEWVHIFASYGVARMSGLFWWECRDVSPWILQHVLLMWHGVWYVPYSMKLQVFDLAQLQSVFQNSCVPGQETHSVESNDMYLRIPIRTACWSLQIRMK